MINLLKGNREDTLPFWFDAMQSEKVAFMASSWENWNYENIVMITELISCCECVSRKTKIYKAQCRNCF